MNSRNKKILVATATYNEAGNIREFVARVRATLGGAQDILVIDDNSPDGTSGVVNEIRQTDAAIHLITRPCKAGIGSAHKLMKVFAIANNYDYLVTMDADLSHRPEEIPLLLGSAGENVFVIGSRYAPGGKSDYVGYRKAISFTGNFIARMVLGIDLKEFTTSFRVFDVNLLKKAPLDRLKSNGYSYFMEVVSLMEELGARLVEVPIHFKDREYDVSKIPKSQAAKSMLNLLALAVRRRIRPLTATQTKMDCGPCRLCGEQALLPLWPEIRDGRPGRLSAEDFKCSSVQNGIPSPALGECLCCGLIQSLSHPTDPAVAEFYRAADDDTYLSRFDVKVRTFRKAYNELRRYLPEKPLSILDIGSYYGAFLEVVNAEGHRGCGIEPSRIAARHSIEVLGHNVVNELFTEAAQFPAMNYDVISAWDVIEHLEAPEKFIVEIRKLLKDGGIFVFSTIIMDSMAARFLKGKWHWILPMHLVYFKKRELMNLLQKHGFEVLAYLNHTHYASLAYAARGFGRNKHPFVNKLCCIVADMLPDSMVIPMALGDVRMLICKKVA